MRKIRGKRGLIAAAAVVSALLAVVQNAAAQGMLESQPKPSASNRWSPPEIMEGASATSAPPGSAPQFNNELTLPSIANQQASIPQAPKSDNVKVIPVIPPDQEVMVLPQASRDFLGQWGGKISLANKFGDIEPPEYDVVSLTFGERDGQVVMATTVWGNRSSQILKSNATAESPTEVTLEISGLELASDPPERHVEKLTLTVNPDNQVQCRKRVDFYVSGFPHPAAEAVYEGTLKPLTASRDRALSEDVMRTGRVPRWQIEKGNPPAQQPSE
jgi:hypothetical protein